MRAALVAIVVCTMPPIVVGAAGAERVVTDFEGLAWPV